MKRTNKLALAMAAGSLFFVGGGMHQIAHALNPFWTNHNFSIANGQEGGVATFMVPTDSLFVVESLSGRILLPAGQHLTNFNVVSFGPRPAVLHAAPNLISQNSNGIDTYLFNHFTRAYFSGEVYISVTRGELQGEASINCALAGYLIPALTGDYNSNGTVDAADYTIWRSSFAATGHGLAADGDGSNEVDPGDYAVWQSSFGAASASGSAAAADALSPTAVPEPATWVLLALVLVGVRARRHLCC